MTTPRCQYVFIDESGDLGKHGSHYFTLVALSVYEKAQLSRIIKKARQNFLVKTIKETNELKAAKSNNRIRKFVLSSLNKCDCRISVIVISKEDMYKNLFEVPELFYNYLCGLLFGHITLDTTRVEIVVDKRHSNRILRDDFDEYILKKISKKAEWVAPSISHIDSFAMNELQVTDFVAWAVSRKFCAGESFFYDLFKDKIINHDKEIIWK